MTADGDGLAEAVAATLATLELEVAGWTVGDGWSAAAPNLERTYRRGRKAFRHAYRQPSDEGFHEWRKDVKTLWYHLRVLEPLWPGVIAGLAAQAGRLADLLGAAPAFRSVVDATADDLRPVGPWASYTNQNDQQRSYLFRDGFMTVTYFPVRGGGPGEDLVVVQYAMPHD